MFAVTEVPATVHVPATSEPRDSELSAAAVAGAQPTDVYSTLKLDVTVDSIKLELFSGDSDLVSDSHYYRASYASTVLAVIMCLSVCPSQVRVVQRWLNLGSQTMPYGLQKSWRNSNDVTLNRGAK